MTGTITVALQFLHLFENGSCQAGYCVEKIMKRKTPIWVTFVLIFAAIACMAFGIYRGELDTILAKAINICMECIGLG